jgi:hypothetical protein
MINRNGTAFCSGSCKGLIFPSHLLFDNLHDDTLSCHETIFITSPTNPTKAPPHPLPPPISHFDLSTDIPPSFTFDYAMVSQYRLHVTLSSVSFRIMKTPYLSFPFLLQLLPLKESILSLAVSMRSPPSEFLILESFPDFPAKSDQLIYASLVTI